MIYDALFLIFGLALLAMAGEILVRGAVGLASILGMSPTIIGLTVVSFGTSAPELLVTISANLNDAPGMALGNVVGSNIANILLVLGVCAMITKLPKPDPRLRTETLFMAGTSLLFALLLLLHEGISRLDGLAMLACLALFLYRSVMVPDEAPATDTQIPKIVAWKAISLTIMGLVMLPLAAELLVSSASSLARMIGISEAVIGLSIVAVGTSLPELAASVMAMFKGEKELAFGNVVGSNLFNIAFIIGATSMIGPLDASGMNLPIDLGFFLATTLLLSLLVFKHVSLGRLWGLAMLGLYAIFMAVIF